MNAHLRLACLTALLCCPWTACSNSENNDKQDTGTTVDVFHETRLSDGPSLDAGADVGPDQTETSEEVSQPPLPPGTVRFVHISDVHYSGTPENPSSGKLLAAVAKLNELNFDADLVMITGDRVHWMPDKYNDPQLEGPMHLFVNFMNQLDLPWLSTPGNHDYYSVLEPFTLTSDKEAREAAHTAVYGTSPYYAHTVNGVKLIALNSLDGPLWNANGGLAGAFSEQQLDWLDNELADEVPALLFQHHPPATVLTTEGGRSLCDVLSDHPGVAKAFFAGHLHSFQKGEYCNIPYFAVTSVKPDQEFFFLVEYDGPNDTLTLVNEAHIPFVEPPDFDCEEGKNPIESFESAVGTFQQLSPFNMTGDLPDIGSYAAEIFESVPFVLHFDAWNQDQSRYETRITLASRWGDNGDYLEYLDGAPCLPLDLDVSEPCFTAGPISLAIDVTSMLGIVPDVGEFNPDWDLKLHIQNFWLEGRLAEVDGVPVIEAGVLHARLLGTKALTDLKVLLVDEYCQEAIPDCTPGAEEMPECPVENPGVKFFTSVPNGCDLEIAGYSLRMIIMMAEGFGLTDMDVLGEIESGVLETSADVAGGFVDPTLFDETPAMNCSN